MLEALLASVVLALSVLGVATVLTAASNQTRAMSGDLTAQALARSLLEEVAAKPFSPPVSGDHAGFNQGNRDRSTYDNIADYDGYTDSTSATAATPAKTLSGETMDFGDGGDFTRSVSFEYRSSPSGAAAASGGFGMIAVSVSSRCGQTTKLFRLVSNVPVVR